MDNEEKQEVVVESKDVAAVVEEVKSENTKSEESTCSHGKSRIKDDPRASVYERTEMDQKRYDDGRNTALVLGILAIVSTTIACIVIFSLIGLILGIIAIVKGARSRKVSSAGLAGWLLGILSVILSSFGIIFWFYSLYNFSMYSGQYFGHSSSMWF